MNQTDTGTDVQQTRKWTLARKGTETEHEHEYRILQKYASTKHSNYDLSHIERSHNYELSHIYLIHLEISYNQKHF